MSDGAGMNAEGAVADLSHQGLYGTGFPNAVDQRRARRVAKRLIDLLVTSAALVVFGPAMILTALAIRYGGGPALFRHERIGANGKPFHCLKFRTMCVDADRKLKEHLAKDPDAAREWSECQKLKNDPRITFVGRFLRTWSIDELPQLLNVLRGDMSIVGPRPIVRSEIEKYAEYFALYASVRPGITGLWQVSGRSGTSYDERVLLDKKYVENQSILADIRIIALTIPAVFAARGAV